MLVWKWLQVFPVVYLGFTYILGCDIVFNCIWFMDEIVFYHLQLCMFLNVILYLVTFVLCMFLNVILYLITYI